MGVILCGKKHAASGMRQCDACAHAYKIRKWRPSQRTADTECCEWLLLTLKL